MKSNQKIPLSEESVDEIELDSTSIDASSSVDDFIKELEAKEKDLHITADMTIEVEESEFDLGNVPDIVQPKRAVAKANVAVVAKGVSSPSGTAHVHELEGEIASLKEKIANLRAERNDIQEKSDRRMKDFGNYKYRMDRERRGTFIDQISNLASQMLPILDNLDRALDAADGIESERTPEFQLFYDGIVLVNQQIREVLGGMGVQPIATLGEMFDPNLHEAVSVEERDDISVNTILDEMLRGYRIGNRVIRHSMVKVAAAQPNARVDESEPSPEEVDMQDTPEPSPENDPPEVDPSTDESE
jgi:molecular chaperone GrpE